MHHGHGHHRHRRGQLFESLRKLFPGGSCHGCHGPMQEQSHGLIKISLVGTPNVGKSVVFNRLTGAYVTVSNYPGTTVEVSRGKSRFGDEVYEIIDTPGMYSLLPITEEERVTRTLLLAEHPEVVIHVVDAKNLQRMLPLTFQLIEAGFPVILNLNIMDEAESLGVRIDVERLQAELGIPVVATAAATGWGMDRLRQVIHDYVKEHGLVRGEAGHVSLTA